jgi:hypothetical protein
MRFPAGLVGEEKGAPPKSQSQSPSSPRPCPTLPPPQELVNGREIFEHLFVGIEKEIVAEEVTVEKEVGIL